MLKRIYSMYLIFMYFIKHLYLVYKYFSKLISKVLVKLICVTARIDMILLGGAHDTV